MMENAPLENNSPYVKHNFTGPEVWGKCTTGKWWKMYCWKMTD